MKLTVTVITRDEAHHIAAAIESVSWADEIVVVDSRSTDDTAAIARRAGARVDVRDWPGFAAQKNHAASLASHDWILSLDADERVSPELAAEIRQLLQSGPRASGYRIPRVTWYLGRWIRTTDWYPDYQLRLYDRRAGRWNARLVHESVGIDGTPGVLRHELQHYAYRDISHHLATIDRYTTLASHQAYAEGRRAGAWSALVYSRLAFARNWILKRGFLDGGTGLIVSMLNSHYVFLKYAKLWELQNVAGGRDPGSGDRSLGSSSRLELDPGSRTPEAGPRTPDPGSRTPEAGPRTPDPGGRTPDPGPRTPDPG